jgi:pimeloyl-ACP methyl ester carboxylesterase
MSGTVVVLHGIWMRARVTDVLARRLRNADFEVLQIDYPSVRSRFVDMLDRLDNALSRTTAPASIVGHSLGGLVAAHYVRQATRPVKRLVCLGSPLTGSLLAQRLKRWHLARAALGGAEQALVEGLHNWDSPVPMGVIAGRISVGLSWVLGPLPRPNDGTVAVAETELAGIADHRVIAASHTSLLFNAEAAALTERFLRDGHF